MDKSKVLAKLRKLSQNETIMPNFNLSNRAEIAVIMESFNISWSELKLPAATFSTVYTCVKSESELRADFDKEMNILLQAKEKDLQNQENYMRHSIIGFINGVKFFNPKLSEELAQSADKQLAHHNKQLQGVIIC